MYDVDCISSRHLCIFTQLSYAWTWNHQQEEPQSSALLYSLKIARITDVVILFYHSKAEEVKLCK